MIILSANRLSKVYGTDVILQDVSFHVNAGDRVGIVGRNGAGKTTLLKLLTGELTADEGEFFVSQDTRVGYLKQRDNFDSEGTVIGEIDKIFTEIHAPRSTDRTGDRGDRSRQKRCGADRKTRSSAPCL